MFPALLHEQCWVRFKGTVPARVTLQLWTRLSISARELLSVICRTLWKLLHRNLNAHMGNESHFRSMHLPRFLLTGWAGGSLSLKLSVVFPINTLRVGSFCLCLCITKGFDFSFSPEKLQLFSLIEFSRQNFQEAYEVFTLCLNCLICKTKVKIILCELLWKAMGEKIFKFRLLVVFGKLRSHSTLSQCISIHCSFKSNWQQS